MIDNGLDDAEALAVDGKCLRGIHGERLPGVHLVSALGHRSGVVIGEKAVGDKGGELGALRQLLGELDIEGRVDYGRCPIQSEGRLRSNRVKRGDYFFVVKDNQKGLLEDIQAVWTEEEAVSYKSVEKRSGRVVSRAIWTSRMLKGYSDWPGLERVCRIQRTVVKDAETSVDISYAITSLSAERAYPSRLLELSRKHWTIENRLHWVRDVTFDEDRCQVRSGSAPQTLSAIRNEVTSRSV